DDVLDVKRQSLYARLKRLFSTDVIVRNVGGKQLKIKDTDSIMYATDRNSLRDRFNRIRSTAYNAYTRDFALSYQAARMDLFRDYDCIGPDTIIPLPDGSNPTIAELTEKYKNNHQERFWVFSYDYETNSVKLGKAYHPRKKKGTRLGYKVTFDNGQYVIGSLKHPFMMRDGSYKMIYELRVGDSVMPFYQKNYNCKYNKYRKLYNFSKGWQSEHVIIAEQFMRPLNNNEVVHHKNFNGYDNSPDNLQIMTKNEHIFGNPHPKKSNEIRSKTLKKVFKNRNQTGEHNPKYRGDITFSNVKEKALEFYKENSKINLWDFIKHIHCDHSTLQNRLKKKGYNWKSFKNEVELSLNHKIVSIECIGEIEVYDVTVEKYHNFATDSCFVGNTMDMDPILSSALDIYADECLTYNELGKMITVHSNNDNVKRILENLYDEILNVRFNLWSWVRNMCKYGDFYLKLYITPEYGIYMVEPISAYNVERIENSDPFNKRYVKFQVRPADTSQAEILENYEVAHFRLISDSNFLPYGKCLTANNYVETEFGCKRINEIEVGDKVWTFNTNTKIYELSNVLNICNSGVKETLKISTQHNEIECSATHPILVFQNNKSCLEYKQAKDININDLLVITSNKHRKANKMPLNKTLLT
ncbi:MAG TPA: portal protein, partial [Bacteroidales bacterium]|nr:portal protein [Bacteroidales bacterium]